jgi:AraC-like DNA-binding protein
MRRGHSPPRDAAARDVDRGLRQVVSVLLAGGRLDVHLVADSLRTSTRTLQRRLHGAGLTYARVLQQVRFEVARQMLGDPAQKVQDIAHTLGYSDPAHFTRAFKRWTGLAPGAFRRRGRDDSAATRSLRSGTKTPTRRGPLESDRGRV